MPVPRPSCTATSNHTTFWWVDWLSCLSHYRGTQVDEKWTCKVADFGLTDFKPDIDKAQNLQVGSPLPLLSNSQFCFPQMGTPFWTAPEAMEHMQFSEASDVY